MTRTRINSEGGLRLRPDAAAAAAGEPGQRMLSTSYTALAVGISALAFAVPFPVAAAREPLPAIRMAGELVGLALAWSIVFTTAALISLATGDFAAAGVIAAAAELVLAVAIVGFRSRRGVPPECWAFWERQFDELDLYD